MEKGYEKPEEKAFYQKNSQYILREIADEIVLVPTGEAAAEFNGLVTFNKTSAFLWNYLQEKEHLRKSFLHLHGNIKYLLNKVKRM